MSPIAVYPGTFCPPTYGHLEILKEAADIFEQVYVICSINDDKKENWFTLEQCKEQWLTYELPTNVVVVTLYEFVTLKLNPTKLVMIRGLRNRDDAEHEKEVMLLNQKKYGIRKYFYIFSKKEFACCSSSRVRKVAGKLDFVTLKELVSPGVVTELLQKVKGCKNVFLVVGPPGGGKSTFLNFLNKYNSNCVHVLTDEINHQLREALKAHFAGQDLEELALQRPEELKKFIKTPWFKLLSQVVNSVPDGSDIFIEVAYGMQIDKALWRYLGAKILYIGPTADYSMLRQRVIARGTPHLVPFIDKIPNFAKTKKLCLENGLQFNYVNTEGTLAECEEQARQFAVKLNT